MPRLKNSRSTGNALLDRLPAAELDPLLTDAHRVRLAVRAEIPDLGRDAQPVFFPVSGVYSVLLPMADGQSVEVALVDSEGMLGLPAPLGVDAMPLRAVTQVPGECVRVSADRFRAALHAGGAFDALVRRFLAVSLHAAHQSIACNLRHTVEQRLCRWLSGVYDRSEADEFEITQEVLSGMIGASRQKVTAVAGRLQAAGYIEYQRGRVRVLDRGGLEAAGCECLRVLKGAYEQLTL